MVNIVKQKTIGPNGLTYYFFTGESTDTKPTGEYPENSGLYVANGSVFYENDTGTRYEFNTDAEAYQVIGSVEELPPVTAEDNGKVLSVVDGAWDKSVPTKELPAVTADDNGKVLTVVDGVWAKAAASGGSGIRVIETTNSGKTITFINETQQSIFEAIMNGEIVIIKAVAESYNTGSNGVGFYICALITSNTAYFNCITRTYESVTDYNIIRIKKDSTSNTATYSSYSSDDYQGSGPS